MSQPHRRTGRSYLHLLHLVYDIVYLGLLVIASPYLAYKMIVSPKHRAGIRQRLGSLEEWPDRGPRIWIHGVSVGEVLAAKSLIEVLEAELPDHDVVISTTTKTGQEVARKHYPENRVFYYPLDLSWATRRVLKRVNPEAVILMELEIWPNFLLATSETEVPVLLVNGRISEHSFRRYRVLQNIIPEPMDRIMVYCVQTRTYEDRFVRLGVQPDRVHVTGTMKFDNIRTSGTDRLREEKSRELGLGPEAKILMGGSTHPSEEETLLRIFRNLRRDHPEYRLVLVPRHPERLDEVEGMLVRNGAEVVRKTAIAAGRAKAGPDAVIVVDTMGELADLYAAASIVFVGGSLIPHGGQSMIEPAGHGRPILFGPNIRNFQESVDILLDAQAAIMVRDADELEARVLELAGDPEKARAIGNRAREVVLDQKGASRRIMDLIRPWFSPGGRKVTQSV